MLSVILEKSIPLTTVKMLLEQYLLHWYPNSLNPIAEQKVSTPEHSRPKVE
jgi:hypothetical protein